MKYTFQQKQGESSNPEKKNKNYKKYSQDELRESVIGWVMQKKKTTMVQYCKNKPVPRTTLAEFMKSLPDLSEIRNCSGRTLQEVENIFDKYVNKKKEIINKQLIDAHESNLYLSEDEEEGIANLAMLMASCGRGIGLEEVLNLLNIVIKEKTDNRTYIPATIKTVRGLIQRNDKLRKTVRSAASLDPARARQASKQTRDCMFTKLYNYVLLMHELNLCKEKTYCDFKNNQLYNMDECAIDTTRHKTKVLCSMEDAKRLFLITPEGDGKMNVHITIALTSRADGKYTNYFILT